MRQQALGELSDLKHADVKGSQQQVKAKNLNEMNRLWFRGSRRHSYHGSLSRRTGTWAPPGNGNQIWTNLKFKSWKLRVKSQTLKLESQKLEVES